MVNESTEQSYPVFRITQIEDDFVYREEYEKKLEVLGIGKPPRLESEHTLRDVLSVQL